MTALSKSAARRRDMGGLWRWLRDAARHRHAVEHVAQNDVGGYVFDASRGADDHAMGQRERGEIFDVVRDHVAPAVQGRARLRATVQRQRTARAGAEVYVVVAPRIVDQIDDVLLYQILDVDLAHLSLGSQ